MVLHRDDYQVTPAVAAGAFTCKMGNASVLDGAAAISLIYPKRKGPAQWPVPPLALAFL